MNRKFGVDKSFGLSFLRHPWLKTFRMEVASYLEGGNGTKQWPGIEVGHNLRGMLLYLIANWMYGFYAIWG